MLQLTSALSISGRITGAAWVAGLVVLVWWLVAAASGPSAFAQVQWFLSSWLGLLGLFGMTAAAWYHTLNGVRHLFWDAGYGYDIPTTYRSGTPGPAPTVYGGATPPRPAGNVYGAPAPAPTPPAPPAGDATSVLPRLPD